MLRNLLQLLRARIVANNDVVRLASDGLSKLTAMCLDELLCGLSAQSLDTTR